MQIRAYLLLIFLFAASVVLPAQSEEEEMNPLERLEPFVTKWNNRLNSHDAAQLDDFYADTVKYYGKVMLESEVLKAKEISLSKAPTFEQAISDLKMRTVKEGYEVSFDKKTTIDGNEKHYRAYLVLIENASWAEIVAESDETSDRTLARKADAQVLKEGQHCFEAEGVIWPEGAVAAPYYTRYEIKNQKGKLTGTGEHYSWGMRKSYSLVIKGTVKEDNTLALEITATGPMFAEDPQDKMTWEEVRKLSGDQLLAIGQSDMSEFRLLKVECDKP